MVPEIALTPQTVGLVNERFPGRTAVLHHRLTDRQRFDQWWRIRDGQADVVVGPRSAVFAPVPNPGIIIVDEEHEPAYKQVENPPLYHARDTALALARRSGAVCGDGFGHPRCQHLPRGAARTPPVAGPFRTDSRTSRYADPFTSAEIVDMRAELRQGNFSVFSHRLVSALDDTIAAGNRPFCS